MASPSTSSYQDNIGMVNGFANMSGMLPQTPWQTMMPQNSLPTGQQQQQPPQLPNFSYPQMQNQSMQTGVPGMYPVMQQDPTVAAFSNSLAQAMLPAQFLQDAVRLSAPVGSSVNDDELLAKALHDTKKNGLTYRRAIEGLHGVRTTYLLSKAHYIKAVITELTAGEQPRSQSLERLLLRSQATDRSSCVQSRRRSTRTAQALRQATLHDYQTGWRGQETRLASNIFVSH